MWTGLSDVYVAFSGREVLCGVSVAIEPGEKVAIVGPSGSGKSTLLGVLGLLLDPDAGERWVAGERIERTTTVLPGTIAWVHQSSNLVGTWSAIDNASIAALAGNVIVEDAFMSAEEHLAHMGLARHAETPAQLLSGGERQRLCVARALAARPRLLLLDEPTGNLDAASTDAIFARLLEINTKMSMVLVTHDESLARRCDRRLVLRNGTLAA